VIPTPAPARPVDLAGWQKRKGISLAVVAAATNISLRYLEAIERRNFRGLPGGAYGLGYIRQYAQAIHSDVDRLVQDYRAARPEETSEPEPQPSRAWLPRLWNRLRSLC